METITNKTPKMSARERANAVLNKLCFTGHPAVNYHHVERQMDKIKMMDLKGRK